ncbi:hypothetical protein W156_01861 [Staphylococcus aureus DAR3767]|nr:hypothetical protein W156_01861 [Staphylococcus aureus DAR3767]
MTIMLLIGVLGGFISGLIGIGGAIIIYPAILILPPLIGVHILLRDLPLVKYFSVHLVDH